MNRNWSKEEMKTYFLFNHPVKVLLRSESVDVEMEVDCFNGHVLYHVTDGADIIYNTFFDLYDAIDLFYEMKNGEVKNEVEL